MRHCSVCYSELEPGSDLNRHQIPETCVKKLALRLEVIEKALSRMVKPRKRVVKPSNVWRGGHE